MTDRMLSLVVDTRRAMNEGARGIARRQRTRLAEIVAFARERSPYYRELYAAVPPNVTEGAMLPVTSKKQLMARFDDWCTDRDVTLQKVRELTDDPARIGERFLGKYTVATTSGTTGTPGIFVLDDRTMRVTNAIALRLLGSWLTVGDVLRIVARRGRMAIVMASGGHFATAVAAARMRRSRRGRKRIGVFPADTPLPELVTQLNEFRPAVLSPYASTAALLATEQEAGRLRIHPVLLTLSAEGLRTSEYERIARAFDAKVGNSYAATECTFLSYSCEEGWLHVNADWVIVEPVDADHRPVPPGQQSHTVLITNLANRVQPILRYDLGDSVLQRADPCPCGNPLPAIRVQGRASDVLTFEATDGREVRVAPLAFTLAIEAIHGIDLWQIVQTDRNIIRIRLRVESASDDYAIRGSVADAVKRMLARHGLENVTVEQAEETPEQSAAGKFRHVIPLSAREPRP